MTTSPGIDIAFCWPFGDADPAPNLTFLRSCGFEGIELWPDALDAHGPEAWANALAKTGMRAVQLCPYFNFMEGQPKIALSRAEFDRFLLAARELNCRRLRVFTGPPWGGRIVGAHDATEAQWDAAIRGLTEYCGEAAPYGVELCLECHGGSLMEDSPSALRLIQAVCRENLTVNLQLPLVGEDWQASVAALGPYTTHIHIHNWTVALGEGDLVSLGAGKFDWQPVVRALVVDHGRHVTLSVEHADHSRGDDPYETARADGPYLVALRERILRSVAPS